MECLTDNKNRTVSELRHVLSKYGGSLGTNGSVAHLFKKVGIIKVLDMTEEELTSHMESIDLIDFEIIEGGCILFTNPSQLFEVKKYLEDKSIKVESEEITMDPITLINIDNDQQTKINNLSDKLEEIDDVQNIYMNVNLS